MPSSIGKKPSIFERIKAKIFGKKDVNQETSHEESIHAANIHGSPTIKEDSIGAECTVLPTLSNELNEKGKITTLQENKGKVKYPVVTLPFVKKEGKNLVVSEFYTKKTSIRVLAGGMKYDYGEAKLKIGDKILVATKKENGISFECYRVISLENKNNCERIYSTKIIRYSDIGRVKEGSFKEFIYKAVKRFPL